MLNCCCFFQSTSSVYFFWNHLRVELGVASILGTNISVALTLKNVMNGTLSGRVPDMNNKSLEVILGLRSFFCWDTVSQNDLVRFSSTLGWNLKSKSWNCTLNPNQVRAVAPSDSSENSSLPCKWWKRVPWHSQQKEGKNCGHLNTHTNTQLFSLLIATSQGFRKGEGRLKCCSVASTHASLNLTVVKLSLKDLVETVLICQEVEVKTKVGW